MTWGIFSGIVILTLGVLLLIFRHQFVKLVLWGMRRFYGQPVADMFEYRGQAGVIVAGVGFVLFGASWIVFPVLGIS